MIEKIGILGYGIVGQATHQGILKNIPVVIYDKALEYKFEKLTDMDYIFVCIPTDDEKDIDNLINELIAIKKINFNCKFIIRSTVPIGACERIESLINDKIIYIPEFLRQRQWQIDCQSRPLIVSHSGLPLPNWLKEDYIVECSFADAELLKMFSNNYATARVVFANHFYEISKKINADYSNVVDLYQKVQHTDQSYLEANESLRGFGGKCLPKDLDFLINTFEQLGLSQDLFHAVKKDNTKWITTVRKS
jgi:UDPglucose 6-dehydrogenase